MTVSRAPSLRRKSGVKTSIVVPGAAARIAAIDRAKCPAPPSSRSSRSTEVTTTWESPSAAAASATRSGSCGSSRSGRPVATLQKVQARVHTRPRIITVACFCFQHSPIFGQPASSHTVLRLCSRISRRVAWYSGEPGALTRSQSGLREIGLSGRWAFSGWREEAGVGDGGSAAGNIIDEAKVSASLRAQRSNLGQGSLHPSGLPRRSVPRNDKVLPALEVDGAAIGVKHGLVHRLRQGRMGKNGANKFLLGCLQGLGDRKALDQLGHFG